MSEKETQASPSPADIHPAPWSMHDSSGSERIAGGSIYIRDAAGIIVCELPCLVTRELRERAVATARLIATTPDLLDALNALLAIRPGGRALALSVRARAMGGAS